MDPKKITEALAPWQVLIAAVIAIAPGILGIWQAVLQWNPLAWSWREITYASIAAAFVIFVTIRSRRAQTSRLLDPDAVRLDPQSPEHLIGRRDDLNKLLNALANPLVFLVSESGCGKSALLRAGVVPGPAFTERFLPIYIDMSVLDWEDSPRRAVREGFSRMLPVDDSLRGKLDSHSTSEDFSEVFNDYQRRFQRRLLLLLDQFDDFQAQPQHRERFLPRDTRVWQTADQIERENAFWRVLHYCLQNDSVSAVVACREDAAKGLESIRFYREVPQFDLARLEPGLVRMIIDRLTNRPSDRPVIENPEGGWTALRDRLAEDVEARGPLLPQQLKLILGGLRTLRRLTPAAYARVGRVAGLEAAFIAGALAKAARVAGMSDDSTVLQMLTALVDRVRQPPDKTPPKTTAELAIIAGLSEDAAAAALKQLEVDEVLRKRGDSEKEATVWQLDHAYLAQPILRIERERDQWRHLLAERARAYAEATWRNKWGALLPIRTQIQLLAARTQGRFRYGGYRAYALKSLARALPVIVTFALVTELVWAAQEYDAAADIVQTLAGSERELTDYSAAGLARLTTRGWITRWRVERETFNSPQPAEWFASNPEPILRALVRLDPDRLDALVQTNVTAQTLSQPDRRLRAAAGALTIATSPAALSDSTKKAFERAMQEALKSSSDATDFAALGVAIKTLVATLPDGSQDVVQWLAPLQAAISKTTNDPPELLSLAQAYAAAAAKIEGVDPHTPAVLAALRTTNLGFYASPSWVQAYAALIEKFNSADPRITGELAALRSAVAVAVNTSYPLYQASADEYVAAVAKLSNTDPIIPEELAALRNSISKSTIPIVQTLASFYVAAVARLKDTDPHVGEELIALRTAISNSTDIDRLYALATAYAAAAAKLGNAEPNAQKILSTLRDAIGKSVDTNQLLGLAQAYSAVTANTDADPDAPEVLAALRGAITKNADRRQLSTLARAYASTATKLNRADPAVSQEIDLLRDALSHAGDLYQLQALARSYAALVTNLKDIDAPVREALARIRDKMDKDPVENATLAQSYAAIISKIKITDPHTLDILPLVRNSMLKTTFPPILEDLGDAYAVIAGKLEDSDVRIATELAALREMSGNAHDSDQLSELMHAYTAVAAILRDGDSRVPTELFGLRDEIISANSDRQLQTCVRGYVVLATKLMNGDARRSSELVALSEAMSNTADPFKLQALAQAYAAAAKHAQLADTPQRDIAILLGRMTDLRTADQSEAFVSALKEAVRLGQRPLSVDKIGLVYVAALLQPISAGEPSRMLVSDFEGIVRERDTRKLEKSWSGDVWAFARWARESLPGFDMHYPKLDFLPAVNLPTPQ